jgi:hypothetical protein
MRRSSEKIHWESEAYSHSGLDLLLASLMTSGVSRLRVPSWSSGPYNPHAEYGGSDGFNGSWENEGRGIVK